MDNNTANGKLKHLVKSFLDWNYNSDILNIICSYIYLLPVDKVKYYGDEQKSKYNDVMIELIRGIRIKTPYQCSYCKQVCYNQNHQLVCPIMVNCGNCNYRGNSNSDYLQHAQNECELSPMKCEYCKIKTYRQCMNEHYNNCDKLFKCDKCNLLYTTDNENLHQLFCQ